VSGIVGIVQPESRPVDGALLRSMTAAMTYRGPDAQATWREGPVGLGHTMLRTTWEASIAPFRIWMRALRSAR